VRQNISYWPANVYLTHAVISVKAWRISHKIRVFECSVSSLHGHFSIIVMIVAVFYLVSTLKLQVDHVAWTCHAEACLDVPVRMVHSLTVDKVDSCRKTSLATRVCCIGLSSIGLCLRRPSWSCRCPLRDSLWLQSQRVRIYITLNHFGLKECELNLTKCHWYVWRLISCHFVHWCTIVVQSVLLPHTRVRRSVVKGVPRYYRYNRYNSTTGTVYLGTVRVCSSYIHIHECIY
jgi:hypothetical protein